METIVITALVTGFVAFWGGYILKRSTDGGILSDHEGRIRAVEEAVVYLRTLVEERHGK